MSQVYFKRCDRCGQLAAQAIVPNPPGWVSMADNGIGTLACFDLCPACQEQMGVRQMFRKRLRANAVGALKQMIPLEEMPELSASLHFDEILAKIEAGEYDEAFDSAAGIDIRSEVAELAAENDVAVGELMEAFDVA